MKMSAESKIANTIEEFIELASLAKPGSLIPVTLELSKKLSYRQLTQTQVIQPMELEHDVVNAPSHYLQTKISPLEVIEDWKLDFHLGSVIKYIGRHPHKGAPLEDLKKAQWYLARKIKLMEEYEAKNP